MKEAGEKWGPDPVLARGHQLTGLLGDWEALDKGDHAVSERQRLLRASLGERDGPGDCWFCCVVLCCAVLWCGVWFLCLVGRRGSVQGAV